MEKHGQMALQLLLSTKSLLSSSSIQWPVLVLELGIVSASYARVVGIVTLLTLLHYK